jgi:hypothetical protein
VKKNEWERAWESAKEPMLEKRPELGSALEPADEKQPVPASAPELARGTSLASVIEQERVRGN